MARYINASQLGALISTIPDSSSIQLIGNSLGNLAIFDKDGIYLGYIDMKSNEVEYIKDMDDEE